MKRLLVPLFALGVLLSACSPVEDDGAGPIKIGMISALTGDAAAIGVDQLNGVRMAIDEVNAKGGINGRMVKLIPEDGRCTGTEAASAAQKLVNVDRVSIIIGGLCSSETLAAAPIVESAKVVLFSPSSSSPDVTNAGDFVFRNYPSDALKTKAMAAYFAERGIKHIAMLSENTDYSQALRASLKADVPENTVVFDEVFDPGTKDFRSLFTRLKSLEFDAVFSNSNSDALNAVIVQQVRDMGIDTEIIGVDTMDSTVVAKVGDAAEGVIIINVDTAGAGTAFETSFVSAYGDPQSSIAWAAYPYDAAHLALQAIAEVGNNGTAIRDYLYGITYNGAIGTFSFDDNGDPLGISYVLKKIQDGEIVTVKPLPVE